MQRLLVALLPRLEADEDAAEVRLVGAGDGAIPADRLIRIDGLDLRQDLLDLAQHRAGPLERGRRWELDGHPEQTLILVGDEAGWYPAPEEADSDHHDPDEQDRHHRAPDEQAGHADVTRRRGVEHAVEAAEEDAERAPRGAGGLEEHGGERGRQRERAERREEHRDRDGEGELLVHLPGEAAEERDGDEHGGEDERDPDDRRRHFFHRLPRGVAGAQAVLDVVHDGLDDDDRVVHDDADGEHEAEHRERVDREAQQREEDERANDRDRHRQQRDDRGPHVLEKDEDDERDEDQRLDERLHDLVDRGLDRRRGVVDDLVVQAGWKQILGRGHGLVDRLGRLELVRAGEQVDRHRAGGLAVQPAERVVILAAQLGTPHVADAHHRSGGRLTDDDVLELVRGHEATRRAHREGERLVGGRRRLSDPAGWRLEILVLDGGDHV